MLLHFQIALGLVVVPVIVLCGFTRSIRPLVGGIAGLVMAGSLVYALFLLTSVMGALGYFPAPRDALPSFYFGGAFYYPPWWPIGAASLLGMAAGATVGSAIEFRRRSSREA